MQLVQHLNFVQIAQQCGKLDLDKKRDRNATVSCCNIPFFAQPSSLNLLMKISWEQKKSRMLKLKPMRTFCNATLSKNYAGLASPDRSTDESPFFESREAHWSFLVTRLLGVKT